MGKKLMKNLVLLCAVIVLCFAVSTMVSAETWGDYEYSVLENGTVEITRYTGTEANLEIPEEICGMKVTSIGKDAFAGCPYIISVSMPNTIIQVLDCAFENCVYLQDIKLSDNLEYIGFSAFLSCVSLKELKLPDSLTFLGDAAICYCFGLTELVIPEKIIRENANGPSVTTCFFIDKLYIESMDCNMDDIKWYINLPISPLRLVDLSQERAIELYILMLIEASTGEDFGASEEFDRHIVPLDTENFYDSVISTVYCHAGSTCEALAIEYGFEYELTHFFKGEWTYDYDNMIRTRKCIHCDELETEDLKTASDNGVEVIVPGTDTKVEVEVVDKNSDNYILVENKLSETIDSNYKILKVFDINLKNNEGVHVKADGTVKVKLPLDWEKDGDYKVYRLNDDGTLTDMNAYRQGSHMIFDTDHFSIYVIVEENVQEEAPEVTPDEEKKDDLYAKILDWFRSLLDLILRLFNI